MVSTGDDPLWYKDAIVYQLHVRAFADGDGDGIGDFAGLTAKLDYLANLGVTAVWLLPFYPSPLRDGGYDIADYVGVNPVYGDLAAFRRFLKEAHRRGLKVITELVINHTSDQHPWFQRSRRAAPGTTARNFYVWSDTPERYREARIIFQDFETSNWSWDPVAGAYYWHRFYHHQPDLNFEEPAVRRSVVEAMDFWLEMGVDGLRLDAVPYLFEAEGTNCENLPATHAFLKELRAHVDAHFAGRMLLAEANQWPDDAVAYFGQGDECHMAFHFPVMPRLYMALQQEDRFPVIDILEQTPAIPANCQWATFLRNHDELTLEMVTDEDRDAMVRVYAADPRARINLGIRRRLAPLLGNDRRRIELMNALLFSLPGAPVVYYGDEIGMGDNIFLGDRDGVRTPMQWSADRNGGFSRANPQRLFLPVISDPEYRFEAVNVEAQEGNSHSLLWWTRRLIALRRRHPAFSRGDVIFLKPANHRVLAFLRRHGEELILVAANLSRFVQHVELDLAGAPGAPTPPGELVGMTPVEVFGNNRFPRIGELPYLLTLGPHDFYWFTLERDGAGIGGRPPGEGLDEIPPVRLAGGWSGVMQPPARGDLEAALARALPRRPWFGGRGGSVRAVTLERAIPVRDVATGLDACFVLARIDLSEGEAKTYGLALAMAAGEESEALAAARPETVVARLASQGDGGGASDGDGVLFDALETPSFLRALLAAFLRRGRVRAGDVALVASATRALRRIAGPRPAELPCRTVEAARQSLSIVFGDRLVLKLFHRVEAGVHPDLEVGRYLTEVAAFPHAPAVLGALELRPARGEAATVAVLREYVAHECDAWSLTLDALGRFYERLAARPGDGQSPPPAAAAQGGPLDWLGAGLAADELELLGTFPERARTMGERIAEMHLALAAGSEPAFAPEPFSTLYQRSLYQSMRSLAGRNLRRLAAELDGLDEPAAGRARRLLESGDRLAARFGVLRRERFDALRMRIHGDLDLTNLLWTGRDFVIVDFEGDPARPVSERRIKRSPLADVAGMIRSFHLAAASAGDRHASTGYRPVHPGWPRAWARWTAGAFLGGYLGRAAGWPALPAERRRLAALLEVFLLDRTVAELGFARLRRAGWMAVTLEGILDLLEER
jgi:maltose alpha-D-glucosyltransferase / alpha-amylase